MIIKTKTNINSHIGFIVEGVGVRAIPVPGGYKVNYGEHTGIFIPEDAAFPLNDGPKTDNRKSRI